MPEPIATPPHELSGIHTRGIWTFIAIFIPSAFLILLFVWLTYGAIVHHLARSEAHAPLIGQDTPTLDQPLQPSPGHPTLDWQDLTALKHSQLHQLTTYGPLPKNLTHAHIPIDRAMQLLLQSGSLDAPPTSPTTQPYLNTTQPTPTENRT
jgi:hypothetical protein